MHARPDVSHRYHRHNGHNEVSTNSQFGVSR